MSFTLHSTIQVSGFVTLKKFIVGKNLRQIESLLGFHQGRLKLGATSGSGRSAMEADPPETG